MKTLNLLILLVVLEVSSAYSNANAEDAAKQPNAAPAEQQQAQPAPAPAVIPQQDYPFAIPALPGELDTVELKNYNPDLDKDIIYTCAFGRAEDISILLKRGGNPNAKNRNGWSAIAIAADRKDPEALQIVKVLAEAGANLDVADVDNNYPIINAIKNHRTDIIEYLISKKASIAVTDIDGNTLVQIANRNKYKEVEDLLDRRIKEIEKELAARRSRENMDKLAKDVLRSTCLGQFNEYVGKRNNNLSKAEQVARLDAARRYKKLAEITANELMEIFHFNQNELDTMINKTNARLVEDLDFLGARKSESGYGSQGYMVRKCNTLVDLWKIKAPVEKNTEQDKAK